MADALLHDLDSSRFESIALRWLAEWGGALCVVLPDGEIVLAAGTCGQCDRLDCCTARRYAVQEGLRWGEPILQERPAGHLLWAVPLTHNALLIGGLVACIPDEVAFPADGEIGIDLRRACDSLRELAESENLTNAALLAVRRAVHEREQKRAEAIHDIKAGSACQALVQYLEEEPALLAAIRHGDRNRAVAILNRILVVIYHQGRDRFDLVKSLILELVVTMSRTAVEAGGEADELFGMNYQALVRLGAIRSEEELSSWISGTLNRILDSIERQPVQDSDAQVQAGIDFIHQRHADPISRDDAAAAAHLSGSHFSRLLKQKTGHGFTDLLNQVRVDRAAHLLRRTDLSLTAVALEVGFSDQSYFTRVFRRIMGTTPGDFRTRGR